MMAKAKLISINEMGKQKDQFPLSSREKLNMKRQGNKKFIRRVLAGGFEVRISDVG